ncbi:MAG: alpha/beta hydrolase [Xanthobacteraceae bacterium]|nr:alpha/beta hydrolase [Xanthobacteraceae bacterium]
MAQIEPIRGGYVRLAIAGRQHRVYFEEAGSGIPLLCLHTAGGDCRQYRGVLNDPAVTSKFRVVTFDLPWHGKSSPPEGWQNDEYQLTPDAYIATIFAMMDALKLDKPALMGCSIGGRVVLSFAIQHPERFRALIGLESSAFTAPHYDTQWAHRPDVHGGEACAALVSGAFGIDIPEADRWETLWHYMQSGPGVFRGDLHFYRSTDLREHLHKIDTKNCPLYFLTGNYDYSASPADTEAVLSKVKGAWYREMTGLGHFPMSEDPRRFVHDYLVPVLEMVLENEKVAIAS